MHPKKDWVMHQYNIKEFGTTPYDGQDFNAGLEGSQAQAVKFP